MEVKAKSDRVFTSKGAAADRNNLLNDVAYQVFVLQKCGIKITKVSFLLLNHLFRKTKDAVSLKELFVIVSDFIHRKKTINFLEYCSSQYDNIEKTLVALWSQ